MLQKKVQTLHREGTLCCDGFLPPIKSWKSIDLYLHGDAEGTGLARDRIICELRCDALFEYRDTGRNGQWMVYIGWWAPAIEPVTGFLAVHMLNKISENEWMRRSYRGTVTA